MYKSLPLLQGYMDRSSWGTRRATEDECVKPCCVREATTYTQGYMARSSWRAVVCSGPTTIKTGKLPVAVAVCSSAVCSSGCL